MTNVSIEPGEWALEELIADTDEGVYIEMNRSWSIDDKRLNFQFGTEIGYEIRNGKLGRRDAAGGLDSAMLHMAMRRRNLQISLLMVPTPCRDL